MSRNNLALIVRLRAECDELRAAAEYLSTYNAVLREAQCVRDKLKAELHQRNGELLVARMELDMLRDDVRWAVALLPGQPGAALEMLMSALGTQETTHA